MPRKKQTNLNGAVAASVAAGAVGKYIEKHPEVVEYAGRKAKTAINVGLILFGVAIVSTAGALYYNLYWKNRFRKMEYDPNQKPVTISAGLAKSKADILFRAMHGIGANYNAFGKRTPASSFSFGNKNDMDLSQWLVDQFSGSELAALRAQVGSGFF